jgi:hypothetical protein
MTTPKEMHKEAAISYTEITFGSKRFFASKDEAQKHFIEHIARFGGSGWLYAGVLELDNECYYALTQSEDKPKEYALSTGYDCGIWAKVHPQSMIFDDSMAATINKEDVGK